jgi:hypothetical protein
MKLALILLIVFSIGCGGNTPAATPTPPPANADLSGSWEIVEANHFSQDALDPCAGCFFASSETLVETVITQTNGNWQGHITIPIDVAFFDFNEANDWAQAEILVGGACNGDAATNLTGTVAGKSVTFVLQEGDAVFQGSGTVNADGTITGNYTGGSNCSDPGGTFTARKTSPINGSLGNVVFGDPTFALSLNQAAADSSGVSSIMATGSDATDGNFTFSGEVIGNIAMLSGTLQLTALAKPATGRLRVELKPRAQFPNDTFVLVVPRANFGSQLSDQTLEIVMDGFELTQAGEGRYAIGVLQ